MLSYKHCHELWYAFHQSLPFSFPPGPLPTLSSYIFYSSQPLPFSGYIPSFALSPSTYFHVLRFPFHINFSSRSDLLPILICPMFLPYFSLPLFVSPHLSTPLFIFLPPSNPSFTHMPPFSSPSILTSHLSFYLIFPYPFPNVYLSCSLYLVPFYLHPLSFS